MSSAEGPNVEAVAGRLNIPYEQLAEIRATALRGRVNPLPSASVVGRVWSVAAREPGRVAIEGDDLVITYGQLAGWVVALRARLTKAGVVQGSRVVVLASRSAFVPAVFLALESLGAVYVPLDESSSEERRRLVLDAATPDLVVTDDLGSCPAGDGPLQKAPRDWPATDVRYCVFTSGTTGQPKGALVEQRGMLNHLAAKVEDLELGPEDRIAFTAPLGFDISVWQMLVAFMCGARVIVLGHAVTGFPHLLARAVSEHQVTVLEVVPAVATSLSRAATRRKIDFPALRWLLCTGEELRPQLAHDLLDTLTGTRLMNAYGPTECSDDVTHHVVLTTDANATRIPIGRPIRGCVMYRLVPDQGRWRVPRPGEAAELFVGGICVGPGYLGADETTRRAYFSDLLDPSSPTGRLYRTGDIVQLDGGVLIYLGRSDRRVKVGGVRVELGEVETVLQAHAAVVEAAALLDEARGRIVAIVVADAGSENSIREHCGRWLNPAVVPASIIRVAALPRTSHGKTDFRRLGAGHIIAETK